MDLNEYQKQLAEGVTFPGAGSGGIGYPTMALLGAIGNLGKQLDASLAQDSLERRVMMLTIAASSMTEAVRLSIRDNQEINKDKLKDSLKNVFSFAFALSNNFNLTVDELAKVMINQHQPIKKYEASKEDIKKDIKNCVIYLTVLCNELKFSLESIINDD